MADGSGRIKISWADGEHTFRLPYAQLRELQDKTGCGPEELAERIRSGRWRVDDLREVIRLGLIGGGMEPMQALTLVIRYVDNRPWLENKQPAYLILLAILVQPEGDKVGKARRKGIPNQTAESLSPSSSELPSQSVSHSMTSGNVRPGNSRPVSKATTATRTAGRTSPVP